MAKRGEMVMTVALSDKRLLNMGEFQIYTNLGENVARNVAEATGALFRVGSRVLVDREKFDKFCDENTEIETGLRK